MKKLLLVAVLTFSFPAGAAIAQDRPLPGADAGGPGSSAVGAPASPQRPKMADVDKNKNGAIELAELPPESQLAKRFSTRDHNGDGSLTPDEYFLP